jgi:hypothetical protein
MVEDDSLSEGWFAGAACTDVMEDKAKLTKVKALQWSKQNRLHVADI